MRQGARGIQSIEVGGRILRALVDACEPMMLKDLAQAADLAAAQCHAYLTSLRHVGLVHQDPATGLYSTGNLALRLGISWIACSPLASAALEELRRFSGNTGVMSVLAAWGPDGPTIIHINAGASQGALNVRLGTTFSVTGTATGRVFAAFGNAPEIGDRIAADFDRSLPRSSIGTVLERRDFEKRIEATRACGYSVAEGVPIPRTNAVAAPIFDSGGALQFTAGLIGPEDELPVGPEAQPVRDLLGITARLSGLGAGAPAARAPLRA